MMELRLNVRIECAALYRVEVARFSHELVGIGRDGTHDGAPVANNFLFFRPRFLRFQACTLDRATAV